MPLSAGDKPGLSDVIAAIGAGGMGEVSTNRGTRLDRAVAIKVVPQYIAQREEQGARFEPKTPLNHPNIRTLQETGPGYMVMELIEGETLAGCIEQDPFPLDQALRFVSQIADALDRAQCAGATHRDVKQQNSIETRHGVKVLDFGLAKSASRPATTEATLTNVLTTEGTVMGTPHYLAPEQFEGKDADARSDIWTFGAVLHERTGFEGKCPASLVGAILGADPTPGAVQPFTPAWPERLVRRQKDPEDRWPPTRILLQSPGWRNHEGL